MDITKLTETAVTNLLRGSVYEMVTDAVRPLVEDVLKTKTAQFVVPVLDVKGDLRFARITIEIPKGTRDGVAYDGYAEAEAYRLEVEAKAEADRVKAEEKARKIARDQAKRDAAKAD